MSSKLDELKKKYEELGKEIEKLEKNKRCRVENDCDYFLVKDYGEIKLDTEYYDEVDDYRYKTRNYFKTEEEAQAYLDNLNTYYELMDLAEKLNNGEKIDWNNIHQEKRYIIYDFFEKELGQYLTHDLINLGQIYCLDKDFLNKAIKIIGKEKLEKLFKRG